MVEHVMVHMLDDEGVSSGWVDVTDIQSFLVIETMANLTGGFAVYDSGEPIGIG